MLLEDRSVVEEQIQMFEDREPTPVTDEKSDDADLDGAVRIINLVRVTMNALRVIAILRHKEDLTNKHPAPILGTEQSFNAYMQAFESLDFILSDLLEEARSVVARHKELPKTASIGNAECSSGD
jgi:hypothetical protein